MSSIVAICHGQNAGSWWNLRTSEAAIVALAVQTLVVRPDERDDGAECGNPPENALRVVGMQAELLPLRCRELLLRFVQDERRHGNQSEVMCQSGEPHGFRLVLAEHAAGDAGGKVAHPVANVPRQRRI